ncbi:MAG: Na+/H+ antiporter NhaC family protein [Candidatus Asgardarchaeum sp.]
MAALLVNHGNPLLGVSQLLTWIQENMGGDFNGALILTSVFLGMMIAFVYKGGGYSAISEYITKRIHSRKAIQIIVAFFGLLICWDDYTNTMVVGTSMRPITDKYDISRAKLAYIIDSTAAPIASIFTVSLWVGFQVSIIAEKLKDLGITENAYSVWLSSLPYILYSFGAILMVLFIVFSSRDFGPMYTEEIRAMKSGKPVRDDAELLMNPESDLGKEGKPTSIWVFFLSLVTLIGVAFFGMWLTGGGPGGIGILEAIKNSDVMKALLWGAVASDIALAFYLLAAKVFSLKETVNIAISGAKLMVYPVMFTVMAWTIGSACSAVDTSGYVVSTVKNLVTPNIIPIILLLLASFTAWSTGSSWGTFAIMIPISIGLVYALTGTIDTIMFASLGAVFSGSIFGDHCSPISDTTVMSSIFSSANHIDHVTTQMPYALTALVATAISFIIFAIIPSISGTVLLLINLVILLIMAYSLSMKFGGSTKELKKSVVEG